MQPEPQLPVLRREVERPGAGGHGLLPVVVLAAAMTSTLAAAGLAMTVAPRAHHCPRSGQRMTPAIAPGQAFVRPAPPAPRLRAVTPAARHDEPVLAAPPFDPACAPRVYRGAGDAQEWTFETCASAPMPRRFVMSK